jgi:hypothetical protein
MKHFYGVRVVGLWLLLLGLSACSDTSNATAKERRNEHLPNSVDVGNLASSAFLPNGGSLSGLSGEEDTNDLYPTNIPLGATNLEISITGGTGDADLYVYVGTLPDNLENYDCHDGVNGNEETCYFPEPEPGKYFILLNSYEAYRDVTLNISYTSGNDPTRFNITLAFGPEVSPYYKRVFRDAAERWENVIAADITDTPVTKAANACGRGDPALNNEVIDDVLIYVTVLPIDGVGKTLAQGGPCFTRNANSPTAFGTFFIDKSDADFPYGITNFDGVIQHEIGHVLGIGTLWPQKKVVNFTQDTSNKGQCGSAARYVGRQSVKVWNELLGGSGNVPVEDDGGVGTACAHWEESVFDSELMTGFIEKVGNLPLTQLTIASLADIGYTVNFNAADSYELPERSQPTNLGSSKVQSVARQSHADLLFPMGTLDKNGNFAPFSNND